MDLEWVAAAVAAIDANLSRIQHRGVGNQPGDGDVTLGDIPGAASLSGTGRPDLVGLFDLPEPHCMPFRKMLAHPAVILRLVSCAARCPHCIARRPAAGF